MPWVENPLQSGINKIWQYEQVSASSTWNVNHGMGIEPLVEVLAYDDSDVLQKAFPLSVIQVDTNNTQINWSSPRAGFATFIAPST